MPTPRTLRSVAVLVAVVAGLPACILPTKDYTPPEPEAPPTPTVPALRLPPNNSYRGSVVTGSLRPTFQWEASAWSGPEPIRYELQFSTDKAFAAGVTTVQTTATSHQPTANLPVATIAPVGSRYFWRVKACVGDQCSAPSPTWWVNLGRTERDVNGDGFADVVVVAPGDFPSVDTAGRLYIFLGGTGSRFDSVPDSVIPATTDTWFRDVAAMGDLNGDGFSDLAAAVSRRDYSAPKIEVYFGSAGVVFDAAPVGITIRCAPGRSASGAPA